jgi:hypothetical protein
VIFFARYEASQDRATHIEPQHLLLGLVREDPEIAKRLWAAMGSEAEFSELMAAQPGARVKTSTSADMPVSQDCVRVLEFAAEEAESLGHRSIEPGHLLLGVLHVPSLASTYLEQHGITLENSRDAMRTDPERLAASQPAAPLAGPVATLTHQIALAVQHLQNQEVSGDQRLKRRPWTRKEALGHLVNLAAAHHLLLARALTEPRVDGVVYPLEEWISAQLYAEYSWPELTELWVSLNRLIAHVLSVVPEEKLPVRCHVGVEESVPLLAVIRRYVADCEDLLGQILAKLD